jgi:hypothetical protein
VRVGVCKWNGRVRVRGRVPPNIYEKALPIIYIS